MQRHDLTQKMGCLENLASRKGFRPEVFATQMSLDDPIEKHIEWAHEHIFRVPYPEDAKSHWRQRKADGRGYHDVGHASRNAFLIRVVINLYRVFDPQNTVWPDVTEAIVKMAQLTGVFNDTGRENDHGEDIWDSDSALILYFYLTRVLSLTHEKAAIWAEIVANKEFANNCVALMRLGQQPFKRLVLRDTGEVTFVAQKNPPDNPLQLLIINWLREVNCLELSRVKLLKFDYLHFFTHFARHNEAALSALTKLYTEYCGLLLHENVLYPYQCDKRSENPYESKSAYTAHVHALKQFSDFEILPTLYADGRLLPLQETTLFRRYTYDSKLGLTDENLKAAYQEGLLFLRAVPLIGEPFAIDPKKKWLANGKLYTQSVAAREFEKGNRRLGRGTSDKPDRFEKEDNPGRSLSLISGASAVPGCVGTFYIAPPETPLEACFDRDAEFGFGKQQHFKTVKARQIDRNTLFQKTKFPPEHNQEKSCLNNEVKATIRFGQETDAKREKSSLVCGGFYFSTDPNALSNHDPLKSHTRSIVALKAVYAQFEYFRKHGSMLPIVEISNYKSQYKVIGTFAENAIIAMWEEVAEACIRKELVVDWEHGGLVFSLFQVTPLTLLKQTSLVTSITIMGKGNKLYPTILFSPDDSYPDALKEKIDIALIAARERGYVAFDNRACLEAEKKECVILTNSTIFNWLMIRPHLQKIPAIQNKIKTELAAQMNHLNCETGFNQLMTGRWCDFRNNAILYRLYLLAKSNDSLIAQRIQDDIRAAFLPYMQKFQLSAEYPWTDKNRVESCLEAAKLFAIWPEVKDLLIALMEKHLQRWLEAKDLGCYNVRTLSELFEIFHTHEICSPEIQRLSLLNVRKFITPYLTTINTESNLVYHYLSMTHYLDISLDEQRDTLIMLIKNQRYYAVDETMYNWVKGINPTLLQREDFFQVILDHCDLDKIKQYLPNQVFTPSQAMLLHKKLNSHAVIYQDATLNLSCLVTYLERQSSLGIPYALREQYVLHCLVEWVKCGLNNNNLELQGISKKASHPIVLKKFFHPSVVEKFLQAIAPLLTEHPSVREELKKKAADLFALDSQPAEKAKAINQLLETAPYLEQKAPNEQKEQKAEPALTHRR